MSIKLEVGTAIATVASTHLDGLANAAAALGAEDDNSIALNIWGMFALNVTIATAPTDRSVVELYIIPAPDGTNYDDSVAGAAGRAPSNSFVGSFELRNVTTAQKIPIWDVKMPPTKWKPFLINRSGQAFPATGSTLKYIGYRMQ